MNKARIAANNRYNEKAYDRINIAVKKGNKEALQIIADNMGESINVFANTAIEQRIKRECPNAEYNLNTLKPKRNKKEPFGSEIH